MSRQRIVLTWNGGLPRRFRSRFSYPVQLSAQQKKLRFGIHQLLRQLKTQRRSPDPIALELALVAVAVWIADTRLSRTKFSEDDWTREIEIVVPVRDPGVWEGHAALLERTLGVLSGDIWRVRFYRADQALRDYIDDMCADVQPRRGAPPIALFSGGLDSHVGAIDALSREQFQPVFVGQTDAGNSSTVDGLKALLERGRSDPLTLFRWKMSCKASDLGETFSGRGELTMRARSFLFFAASVLVATAYGSRKILVPENGFISLNMPLDPWRMGALTTRTTHPYVIARFNELLDSLGLPTGLSNPFQGMTKGEMLAQCADQGLLRRGLGSTVSCSKPKWVRRYRAQYGTSHCGVCWPCLIRRAAVRRAFPSWNDPTRYVKEDLAHLSNEPGEAGHVVRSIQYGLNMLREPDERLRLSLATVAPLRDVEDEIADLVGCVRRGLVEVARVVGLRVPR
ncbi:MAG TPA: Qat anti-phage system QueC-like protein QatC [Luteimonas sp.]|nr:Qat anti-phage system QueC-like protein QatC [Luteimonas sp.]